MVRDYLLLLVFLIISMSGESTSQPTRSKPGENIHFYLRLTSVGTKPGPPREGLVVTIVNNCYNLYRDVFTGNGGPIDTNITLSDSAVKSMIRFIDTTGFFTLEEHYVNDNCRDGPETRVYIRSRGVAKSVHLYCRELEPIRMILHKVLKLAGDSRD